LLTVFHDPINVRFTLKAEILWFSAFSYFAFLRWSSLLRSADASRKTIAGLEITFNRLPSARLSVYLPTTLSPLLALRWTS